MEIFLRVPLSLDAVAQKLREVLNIPEHNQTSYQVDQRRYSDNRGGDYWLFEVLGLELILTRNADAAEIAGRSEWPYYLTVDADPGLDDQTLNCIARHLCDVLRRAGFEGEVDTSGP